MKTTETLSCPECPSTRFVALVTLKLHPTGGTGPSPAGYQCAQCHADVDNARMIQKAERERKMKELRDLQAEMASEKTARLSKEDITETPLAKTSK